MTSLDELLEGLHNEIPVAKLDRPCYRRDGLYGRTPFIPKRTEIVAVTIEQACKSCGGVFLSFGGVYREFSGDSKHFQLTMRSAVKEVQKDQIDRVVTIVEEVTFCPQCLGEGDKLER